MRLKLKSDQRQPVGIGLEAEITILFESELDAIASRAAQYSGSAWAITWDGFGAAVRDEAAAAEVAVPVRRILDDFAKHCATCPGKAGTYDSWDAMLAATGGVPADGSDDCFSNCRCRLQFLGAETDQWSSFFA